jgi:hypothetical protein
MPVTGNVKRLSSRHSNSASAYPRSFLSCSDSFLPAMQEPFPALTFLHLCLPLGSAELTLPETLSGGSAPQLRSLFLNGVSFPALPKLLLSTGHLVSLPLHDSSIEWYISPEVLATCLVALPNLEDLSICPSYESRLFPPIQHNTHWPCRSPKTRTE